MRGQSRLRNRSGRRTGGGMVPAERSVLPKLKYCPVISTRSTNGSGTRAYRCVTRPSRDRDPVRRGPMGEIREEADGAPPTARPTARSTCRAVSRKNAKSPNNTPRRLQCCASARARRSFLLPPPSPFYGGRRTQQNANQFILRCAAALGRVALAPTGAHSTHSSEGVESQSSLPKQSHSPRAPFLCRADPPERRQREPTT